MNETNERLTRYCSDSYVRKFVCIIMQRQWQWQPVVAAAIVCDGKNRLDVHILPILIHLSISPQHSTSTFFCRLLFLWNFHHSFIRAKCMKLMSIVLRNVCKTMISPSWFNSFSSAFLSLVRSFVRLLLLFACTLRHTALAPYSIKQLTY